MRKKVMRIALIIVTLILLFPIPLRLKDGGSVEYRALLYSVTDVHRLNPDIESSEPYLEGLTIEVLGMEIYSNVD